MPTDDQHRGKGSNQRMARRGACEAEAAPSAGRSAVLLDRSIAWIRSFPEATNHDVPADLRDAWILPEESVAEDRKALLTIFLAGYTATKTFSAKHGHACASVSDAEVNDQFENWQLKLVLAKLNAGAGPKSSPVALFGSDDEEIRVII